MAGGTVADLVVGTLKAAGVERIFGVVVDSLAGIHEHGLVRAPGGRAGIRHRDGEGRRQEDRGLARRLARGLDGPLDRARPHRVPRRRPPHARGWLPNPKEIVPTYGIGADACRSTRADTAPVPKIENV